MSGHSDRWGLDDVTARLLRSEEWFFIKPETVNAEYVEHFARLAYKMRATDSQLFDAGKPPRSPTKKRADARDGVILYLWMRGVKLEDIAAYMNDLKKYGVGWNDNRARTYLTQACKRWKIPPLKRPKKASSR